MDNEQAQPLTTQVPSPDDVVAAALEEAAQAFIRPGVLLAMVDQLTAAVQGPAVRSALKERVRMIAEAGRTAESDDLLPVGWLPMEARMRFHDVRDKLRLGDFDVARDLLVEGVAIGLAAIDRLDRATKRGED